MSVRLLHAADLHLDSPFEGLAPDKAALRRAELRALPGQIAALAQDRRADLLLLSGDIFDSLSYYPETGAAFTRALAGLGIDVFIAPGNHDYYCLRSPWTRLELPENVHVFTAPRLERIALPALGVNVYGAGYTSNACGGLLQNVRIDKTPGMLDVLVLHAEVGRPGSPYCPVTEKELAGSGFDYAALGHVHTASGLRKTGNCRYAWPGCSAGRGFDETGEKGVLFTELSEEGCESTFIPLGAREYRVLRLDAGTDIPAALPADARRHIYKIILTGAQEQLPDLERLDVQLREMVFDLTLEDAATPGEDLWARAGENTLRGVFLRRMRARLEAAGDEAARALVLEAARLGLAALEGREVEL